MAFDRNTPLGRSARTMPQPTAPHIPPQHGRTAVITGTGGLGLEAALALARAGAQVVLAGRDAAKGAASVRRIQREVPDARVAFRELDLASLASIRRFSEALAGSGTTLDLLINNAGVMAPPTRQLTADGFELQLGTNHLGHFALTARLLPLLRQAAGARVVTLSSIAAQRGRIDFDNLHAQRHYQPMAVYSQSKLACLMFALELQRRSDAAGWGLRSLAAHPGVARTELLPNGAGRWSLPGLARRGLWFLFQPAAHGAWPSLMAATSPGMEGGTYIGPDGWRELRGAATQVEIPPQALDRDVAARLWADSERLTACTFPAAGRPDGSRTASFTPTRTGIPLLQPAR